MNKEKDTIKMNRKIIRKRELRIQNENSMYLIEY